MSPTNEKLLHCPFCGCKAVWFKTGRDMGIECEDGFDCPGRAQTNVYAPEHRQEVIAEWNRRVDIDGNDIRDLTPSPAPSAAPHQGADALREALVAARTHIDFMRGLEKSVRAIELQSEAIATIDAALAQHQAPQQGEQQ